MSDLVRRALGLLVVTMPLAASFAACNDLLDNRRGTLVEPSETGSSSTADPAADSTDAPSPTAAELDAATSPPTPAVPAGPAGAGDKPPSTCPAGEQACSGTCVSATDPRYGCGAPSCAPCALEHATARCQGPRCAVSRCDQGFADCNGAPADGCESDLSRATTCGACNVVCATDAPTCTPLGPTFTCTRGCPIGTAPRCGGQCLAEADPAACGPACLACPAPPYAIATCTANLCGFGCIAGFGDCDGNAANGCEAVLVVDALHCGQCGRSCNGQPCVGGVCQVPPPAPPRPEPPKTDAAPPVALEAGVVAPPP
jgi:hypothetical protein